MFKHLIQPLEAATNLIAKFIQNIYATWGDEHCYYVCTECGTTSEDEPSTCNELCQVRWCNGGIRAEVLHRLVCDTGMMREDRLYLIVSAQRLIEPILEFIKDLDYPCPWPYHCPLHVELKKLAKGLREIQG
jgi:hypothetical protein